MQTTSSTPMRGPFVMALVALCVTLALVAGCSSTTPNSEAAQAGMAQAETAQPGIAPTGTASNAATAATSTGEYPKLFWMFNVYATPCQVEVGTDGRVRTSTAGKPRLAGTIAADGVRPLFDSIEALQGCSQVSAPALIANVGQQATIESGTADKAGATLTGRSVSVTGSEEAGAVRTRLSVTSTAGSFRVESNAGRELVPVGGALVMIVPSPGGDEPCTLVVARPTILRSLDDHPFQRSSSFGG